MMFFHDITHKTSTICKMSTFLITSVFSKLGATLKKVEDDPTYSGKQRDLYRDDLY